MCSMHFPLCLHSQQTSSMGRFRLIFCLYWIKKYSNKNLLEKMSLSTYQKLKKCKQNSASHQVMDMQTQTYSKDQKWQFAQISNISCRRTQIAVSNIIILLFLGKVHLLQLCTNQVNCSSQDFSFFLSLSLTHIPITFQELACS